MRCLGTPLRLLNLILFVGSLSHLGSSLLALFTVPTSRCRSFLSNGYMEITHSNQNLDFLWQLCAIDYHRVWKRRSGTYWGTTCARSVGKWKPQIKFSSNASWLISFGDVSETSRGAAGHQLLFVAFHTLSGRLTGLSRKLAWLIFSVLSWALWQIRNKAHIEDIFIKHPADAFYKMITFLQL